MATSLTAFERETIINYNQADAQAEVFTYSVKLRNRLEGRGIKPTMVNSRGGASYLIPKGWVRVAVPKGGPPRVDHATPRREPRRPV